MVDSLIALQQPPLTDAISASDEILFGGIAQDIKKQGYSIRSGALPEWLANALLMHQQNMEADRFKNAGIGRGAEYLENEFVRTGEIAWISGKTEAGRNWLEWSASLQGFLNRRLFLGLFSFESNFAHYPPRRLLQKTLRCLSRWR